jgi:hypothetical protein
MARKPGYELGPHTDPVHFAATFLLYFTAAVDEVSGALCLYRPERLPERWHLSTYYVEREEGIGVTLEKAIPIQRNLFVAFLNAKESLHGLRVSSGPGVADIRLAYQTHLVVQGDRKLGDYLGRRTDPVGNRRWEPQDDGLRRQRSGILDHPS